MSPIWIPNMREASHGDETDTSGERERISMTTTRKKFKKLSK
jgi:hypothetical protein